MKEVKTEQNIDLRKLKKDINHLLVYQIKIKNLKGKELLI